MSVIRSALDERRPLGSDFSSKPSSADPSLTLPKTIVTASSGTVINKGRPARRIDHASQECITDITIIKKGGMRWNWEEKTGNGPSRDETFLGLPASLPALPAWRPWSRRRS